MRPLCRLLLCLLTPFLAVGLPPLGTPVLSSPTAYDWLQFDGDAAHSGLNRRETAIAPTTVSRLHVAFSVRLPNPSDAPPVYLHGVSLPTGPHDLLFLTALNGTAYALDAHTGATLWSHPFGPAGCTVNRRTAPCFTTAGPALDPQRTYLYTYGLDGAVHRLDVRDGTEVTGHGWPETVTIKPAEEKGSSDLSVLSHAGRRYLYVSSAGYPGDAGDYQGHITTIDLSSGKQHVFNMLCSARRDVHFADDAAPRCGARRAAVWARAGVVYDASTGRLFAATGNGPYNPSHHQWGDSVLALHPNGTGARGGPVDSYTPADYAQLESDDTDLGSTAPALLPPLPGFPHLLIQSGKDAVLRVLDAANLSGRHGPGIVGGELKINPVPQGSQILTQPVVWTGPAAGFAWILTANDSGISGIRISARSSRLSLHTVWKLRTPCTSPLLAGGVLFCTGNHHVWALEPSTGRTLWTDTSISNIHWESPIVANGMLYIPDLSGRVTAYALG